jgi:hypothetical protein
VLEYVFRKDDGSGLIILSSTSTLNNDEWYHVVFQSTGTTIKMFINGVEDTVNVDSGSNNGDWFGDLGATYTHRYDVGANLQNGTWSNGLDGVISRVRLWSRALSASEIALLYQLTSKKYIYPFSKVTGE